VIWPCSVCSGAIHIGVPIIPIVCPRVADSATSLAMPKSSTFTSVRASAPARFVFARKMFSGLRSRWTMPAACAAATAWHTCSSTSRASPGASAPARSMRVNRSSPSSSSMTMYGVSPSMPALWISTTWSLAIREPTLASSSKRWRAPASFAMSGLMSFSARALPVLCCSTTYTAPIPPSASGRTTR